MAHSSNTDALKSMVPYQHVESSFTQSQVVNLASYYIDFYLVTPQTPDSPKREILE